jgi:hypothetical protein
VRSLSSSDLTRLGEEINAIAEQVSQTGPNGDQQELAMLLRGAVRLYANGSADPYGAASLRALDLTPTEACTAAAALLKSQSLTPFEFSIWFSEGRTGGGER